LRSDVRSHVLPWSIHSIIFMEPKNIYRFHKSPKPDFILRQLKPIRSHTKSRDLILGSNILTDVSDGIPPEGGRLRSSAGYRSSYVPHLHSTGFRIKTPTVSRFS
jgi:hypothetical protein